MSVSDIINQISDNETISVRLCGEDNEPKYVITRQNDVSPRKYKLYKTEKEKIVFTGKSELSPLDLEAEKF